MERFRTQVSSEPRTGNGRRATTLVRLLVLATLAVPSAAAAQRTDEDWLEDCLDRERRNNRYVHCDVRVDRMRAPLGGLRVDAGQNGGVQVVGENRSDVEVHARIQTQAESSADARSLAGEVEIQLSGSVIRARGPSTSRNESWSVSFVILVPQRTDLDLEAHNGPVSVVDVNGTIEARTQNGPLSLRGVAGDVNARTQNGPLTVELSGTRWNGTGLNAETSNGPVNLTIPDGYSARLETGTVNGPFNTDVPLTITYLGRRERHITTTLGNGGPPVRVVTTNGPVNIRGR